MSYLGKTKTAVTLPSGGRISVRRQTKLELVRIGQTPAFFMKRHRLKERAEAIKGTNPEEAARLLAGAESEMTTEQDQALLEYITRQTRILLTSCCVSPLEIDGESYRIVDKDPSEAGKGEISWAMVSDEDTRAILEAIVELSKTGQEAVKTFPERSGNAQGTGQPGATLPVPADRPAEPVAG